MIRFVDVAAAQAREARAKEARVTEDKGKAKPVTPDIVARDIDVTPAGLVEAPGLPSKPARGRKMAKPAKPAKSMRPAKVATAARPR